MLALGLFALVVLLLGRLVPGASRHLAAARPGWLLAGACFEAVACAGYVLAFRATYAPYRVGIVRCTQIALGELAAFALVPTGIGGPALRVWALLAEGLQLRAIATMSISFGAVFNAPYVAAAVALGLGAVAGVLPGHAPLLVELAPLALVAVVLALVPAILRLGRRGRRGGRLWMVAIVGADGLRDVPRLLRSAGALGGSSAYWLLDGATLWAALHAVGSSPPPSVVALAYMLGQLGNLAPLPGGIGGVEPIMLGVLAASGVDTAAGAAAIVCYRALALGLQGAAGSLALGTLLPRLAARTRSGLSVGETRDR